MSKKSKDTKAFPLGETLRDLALLRATEVDLSSLVSPTPSSSSNSTTDDKVKASVDLSYAYVAEARKAVAISNKGKVGTLGEDIENLRGELDEVSQSLAS